MKTKVFIYSLLMALFLMGGSFSFVACEDAMETGSTYAEFEEDNKLNSSADTVYSVIGILSLVQQVADRNVLFGELRGDLVDENENTESDLREIMNFSLSKNNSYNKYGDYYAIINNCNYFLAKADTTLRSETDSTNYIFKKEYAAVKAIRAWTYLQLAQIYKNIPFYTEPLISVADAEKAMEEPFYDMTQLCDFFITDLAGYDEVALPQYGTISNGRTNYSSSLFFFPINLILGDYCLWCGKYDQAANYYYRYITQNDCVTGNQNVEANISTTDKVTGYNDSWTRMFEEVTTGGELISVIAMASEKLQGTKSELENVFSGTEENEYKCPVLPSARYKEISEEQVYAYKRTNNIFTKAGDCRRKVVFDKYPGEEEEDEIGGGGPSMGNSDEEEGEFTNEKYSSGIVYVYRAGEVYLRFAEAINRAGYPSHAFAVLKYGLNTENIGKYVSEDELDGTSYLQFYNVAFANETTGNFGIHKRGSGPATDENDDYAEPLVSIETASAVDSTFTMQDTVLVKEYTYHYGDDLHGFTSDTVYSANKDTVTILNYSKDYAVEKVEDLICNEMALETVFEGTRYYDLLRIALHRNDNKFLANKIAYRKGENNKDETLYNMLLDENNWYFTIEK